jgi:hypothetical protein
MYMWKVRLPLKIPDRRVDINGLLLFLEERLTIEASELDNNKNRSPRASRLDSHENWMD